MFDIGWSELLLIGVVALVVIGPKELPAVLRTVGRTMGKMRRMASEFQGQFQEALREAELDDMRKEIDTVTKTASSSLGSIANTDFLDPLKSIREDIRAQVEAAAPQASPTKPEGEGAGSPTPSTRPEEPLAPGADAGSAQAASPVTTGSAPAPTDAAVPLAEPIPFNLPEAPAPAPAEPTKSAS